MSSPEFFSVTSMTKSAWAWEYLGKIFFVYDGGSINVPGLNMIKNRCAKFETSPIYLCVDHFLNNLGKSLNPPKLALFTLNLTSRFRSLKNSFLWEKIGQFFYDLLLDSVPRVSQVCCVISEYLEFSVGVGVY
jgi:hypothetical protein